MIVVSIGRSPNEKRCIVMTLEDQSEWILFTTKQGPMADSLMRALDSDLSAKSLSGLPLNEYQSLASGELTFIDANGCIGVYVQADRYDELDQVLSNR